MAATSFSERLRDASKRYPLVLMAIVGIAAGLVTLPLNVRLFDGTPFTGSLSHWLFGLVAIVGGIPIVRVTVGEVAKGHIYADVIAALAVIGAVLLGEFEAGAVIVLMSSGGDALEEYGLQRASRSLDSLMKRAPQIAHRQQSDGYTDVPVGEVQVGDILLVRPGDIVPVDGLVTEGRGEVDESALTGEPVPLAKHTGDELFSGTINLSGAMQMRASHPASESKYELIVHMVQQAQEEQAPISRLADRYAPGFTLITFVICIIVYLVYRDWVRVLSVLVVATPCPLIIAVPIAVLSAINRAARKNIIVKSGQSVEQAGGVRVVIFDKTGTLTLGQPTLEMVFTPQNDAAEANRLLQRAASVEQLSSHILARPIVSGARERGLPLLKVADFIETPGKGVSGIVDGHAYAIGSDRYLRSLGIDIGDAYRARLMQIKNEGKLVSIIAEDGQPVAATILSDQIRPEARGLATRLARLGVQRTVMLTGDSEGAARAIAAAVGINEVKANLLPEAKVQAIDELKRQAAKVMMVGDGINDAPALATATVGVAMGGHGAGISTDSADIVITTDDVARVADIIEIGQRMVGVATQGIFFGIGASIALMLITAFFFIPPTIGALLQELIDVLVMLNALRSGMDLPAAASPLGQAMVRSD